MSRSPHADTEQTVDRAIFRDAMSRLGAPVVLVTTNGPAGRQGLTVSAITSVSDDPPTVLVCLNRANRSHETFLDNGAVGISILSDGHDALAGIFASSRLSSDEKFGHATWLDDISGAPLLAGAPVTLDCTIDTLHASGSHDVLFCRVRSIRLQAHARHGLAWFARRFHLLPAD
ncbi:MAG: flavin reductase [Gluconacetobacter sp.]